MKALVEKEIRLLLPAFAGALALAVLPVWLLPRDTWESNMWQTYLCLFGILMLAHSSIGREIGLKTLSFTLAQPLERSRIWWTKVVVLGASVGLVFDAWLVSGSFRAMLRPEMARPLEVLAITGLMAAAFTAGGLWTTVLLRQVAAAFWMTLLVPLAAGVTMSALGAADWMIGAALGLYAAAAFLLARWQFSPLQDTAWTGGVIAFAGRRAGAATSAMRERRPWAALLWKEVQLQQVTLIAMGCILALHLGAIAARKAGAHVFSGATLEILGMFGGLWFFVPALAGSQSVAEERKFGTMEAQLCLPISRKIQWLLKLMVVLVVGGLLSLTLLWAVERATGSGFVHETHGLTLVFLVIALAGFYGSTLASGVVQALAAAALAVLGLTLSVGLLLWLFEIRLVTNPLLLFVGWPALVATLLWLSYRNFGNVSESWRLWRRNAFALATMAVLTVGSTGAVYDRAWEWLTPLEPAHGPARLSSEKATVLRSPDGGEMMALLPDGRLWFDSVGYGARWRFRDHPWSQRWTSGGVNQFAPGSNWVDMAANSSREIVAIRSDGTLWVSKYTHARNLLSRDYTSDFIQFGHDNNWRSVARNSERGMFLLKGDGTLWEWRLNFVKGNRHQPGLLDSTPRQLGKDSDWARLLKGTFGMHAFLWKTNGSAWGLWQDKSTGEDRKLVEQDFGDGILIAHLAGLDNVRWRSLVRAPEAYFFMGVRDDGTLWYWTWIDCWNLWNSKWYIRNAAPVGGSAPVQIGKDSDWTQIAGSLGQLVARKTDGSLWGWDWNHETILSTRGQSGWALPLAPITGPPARLGVHGDWLAVSAFDWTIFSLAADGNLWSWPHPRGLEFRDWEDWQNWIAPSRKPAVIENVLSTSK